MKQYRLIDNVLGWVAFFIAAFVYCSTIEPTASFWDCPEFITTGYKLEVGHPPGAPFFMLTANLFTQFVSDPSDVARMVNTMSALLSATCIMFLFWTITHLVRRLLIDNWDELTTSKTIAIQASGLVGALIYTFSDTFWFSAVEGEVYAYSSAFTAVVFWMILKWEDHADEPHSDRWLVLITYMTGLSIGVHLLNLLCIPAIVLVYYYKRYPNADLKGSLIALAISIVIVAAVLYGVVPGIITVGGWFELFFVNTLGMPFNTGEIVYIALLIGIVVWAIYESYVDKNLISINISCLLAFAMLGIPFYGFGWSAAITGVVILAILYFGLQLKNKKTKAYYVTSRIKNTALNCMLMLMIGYSTYALIVVRSAANPPMDQNSPEDIFTLGNYLSRDQYGDRPLFYGPAYSSQVDLKIEGNMCKPKMSEGAPIYQRVEKKSADEKDAYFVVRNKDSYVYAQNMLFPRMHDSGHAQSYEDWMGGVDTYPVDYDRCGEMVTVNMPTMFENIRFFLSYQCNFMYWRYFMWNFAGRQNDLQGNGELEHGNWITGISFIDNAMLGDQSLLPDELKNNKGHNVFYCLPLILGLIGLFWQAYRGKKGIQQFWVVFFLFFMTGLAIVFYLNQTPLQPRERDYAYAGSFYAFAIWCGMGVAAIIDLIARKTKKENVALAGVISVVGLLVPIQMASQTWDDHDRSGRYCCRDFGQNYLNSMPEESKPIIYTNGDNDTFPLWYNQDVEGVGTGARVCNLSYLQTDWYIDQMMRPAYNSPALPITWSRLDYCSGTNEYIEVAPELKSQIQQFYAENPEAAKKQYGEDPFDIHNVMKYWVRGGKGEMHVIPTDTLFLNIDADAVRKSGMMIPRDTAGNEIQIPEKMAISLKGKRALYKNDLMMLEMISNANWTRPLFVALTVGADNFMNLGDNFIQEGLVNRITPFATNDQTNFDTEKTYDLIMNKFKFGGIDKKGIYLDETVTRMCFTHRRIIGMLITHLLQEGKDDKAAKVLAYTEKVMPMENVPMRYLSGGTDFLQGYYAVGQKKKAEEVFNSMWKNSQQYLSWYLSLNPNRFSQSQRDCMLHFYIMQRMLEITARYDSALAEKKSQEFHNLMNVYQSKGGNFGE
ncbi:MAG: DUF2723 domain-containing protein [Prevotellaceae bacterium]|nr:DUF2723 domain-containing protein [Prevotellaceae bacterium]